jgi:hypothetical protein
MRTGYVPSNNRLRRSRQDGRIRTPTRIVAYLGIYTLASTFFFPAVYLLQTF